MKRLMLGLLAGGGLAYLWRSRSGSDPDFERTWGDTQPRDSVLDPPATNTVNAEATSAAAATTVSAPDAAETALRPPDGPASSL